MDRIIFMVLRNIYRAPFWFYRVVKMGREDAACTEQERYGYIRRMVEEINRTGRVTIRVQGRTGSSCFPTIKDFLTRWRSLRPAPIPLES